MISPQEISQLTQGAVCYIHSHPRDVLNFVEKLELMRVTPVSAQSGNYEVTRNDELILVDTSLQDITITLPLAENGREFSVVKVAAPNKVFVVAMHPSTIIGVEGVQFSGNYTSLRIKAVNQNYILI
jgi:hypothetical protein